MARDDDGDNALLPRGGGLPAPVLVDPLNAMNRGINTAQGMWGIREKQAQEAWGNILQQSTDESGNVDYGKAQAMAAKAGPVAQMGMMSALKDTSGLRTQQFNLNTAQNNSVNAAATAALAEPDDEKMKQTVYQQMMRQVQMGLIPMDKAMAALHNMSPDPATMRQQLETIRVQTLPDDQKQQVIYGTPFRQTGPTGATIGAVQDPRGGAVSSPAQPGAPQGQSPEDLNKLVKIGTDTNGKDIMATQQQAQNLAQGRSMNDNGPAQPGPLGTGRPLPPGLTNPNKPAPATTVPAPAPATPVAPPGVNPLPGGGFTVGQPPATKAAQEATGTASSNKFQAIVDQGVKARSQDALLATMLSEAQGFRPGPGADIAATLKRTILGLGAQVGTTFGIDEDKLAKQESVVKIGNQLADAQGAGSDARMHVSEGANPSVHNTPAGLDLIIRQLRGNADYLRVRQQLAANYPDKANIEEFEAKIGANLDPRVFQYEKLKPEQRADYYNGLTDKAAFRKAHDWAAGQNLLGGGG